MSADPFYKAHWRDIDPQRMAAYRDGFHWDAAADALYRPARIARGQTVADFGCGPGGVAVELARRVGPEGHVHALDINAEFLEIAGVRAEAAGVAGHITTHLNDGGALPLGDGTLDRITARNTLMYVDDPVATLGAFRRVLKPGGLAHAIDGDWYMMVAEPVPHAPWRDLVDAAAHACRHADMGRRLHAAFAEAGFADIEIAIHTRPDTEGRLMGMVRNMAKYAAEHGGMSPGRCSEILATLEAALAEGRYLVVSPQFVVTGRKEG